MLVSAVCKHNIVSGKHFPVEGQRVVPCTASRVVSRRAKNWTKGSKLPPALQCRIFMMFCEVFLCLFGIHDFYLRPDHQLQGTIKGSWSGDLWFILPARLVSSKGYQATYLPYFCVVFGGFVSSLFWIAEVASFVIRKGHLERP